MSTHQPDARARPTVPWICDRCGHFVVLPKGRSTTEHRCPRSDGEHHLVAYSGSTQALMIRNEIDAGGRRR